VEVRCAKGTTHGGLLCNDVRYYSVCVLLIHGTHGGLLCNDVRCYSVCVLLIHGTHGGLLCNDVRYFSVCVLLIHGTHGGLLCNDVRYYFVMNAVLESHSLNYPYISTHSHTYALTFNNFNTDGCYISRASELVDSVYISHTRSLIRYITRTFTLTHPHTH
jgi:hypothetical protein